MVYRMQNHALDLTLPGGEDALLIKVDEKHSATCIHVPRYISKSELIQLLLKVWITNYEKLHQAANQPIESSDSKISTQMDGSMSIRFDDSHLKIDKTKSFPSISMMEVLVQYPNSLYEQLGAYEERTDHSQDLIHHFDNQGNEVFRDPFSGHIYF